MSRALAAVTLAWAAWRSGGADLFEAAVPNVTALAARSLKGTAACGHRLVVGVDYYPEQWPVEDFLPDITAIKEDLGADFVRIGEFMWHLLEPEDGTFDFDFLDKVINTADDLKLEVMLGTPTATPPAWLYMKHPEIFAEGPDAGAGYAAAAPAFGGRQQRSFNSDVYDGYVARIVGKLAERYGQRDIVTFWQVDNEMGNEQSDLDFSQNGQAKWQLWLKEKYDGDIALLNKLWGTVFWSVTYDDFTQISVPRFTRPGGSEQGQEEFRSNMSPGMLLDFRRFRADMLAQYAKRQADILRSAAVMGCITTNINGGYWGRAMDNNAMNAHMDFPAFDNYPVWGGSLAPDPPSKVAMMLDTVRGWAPAKDRSVGFMVAEQLIGAQGHDVIGYTPRPKQIVAWATQTLVHGATSLAFFRYRAADKGQEMFCYGILDHATPRGKGRKWSEAKSFYKLARENEAIWLGPLRPKVALVYHIDTIFSWNAQPQSTAFDYTTEAHRMYHPFWRHGASVDVVSAERVLADFPDGKALRDHYSVLLLPAPIIVPEAFIVLVENFVALGGVVWIGFRADVKDDSNAMRRATSRLAALAGVEVEEIESLNAPLQVALSADPSEGKPQGCKRNSSEHRDRLRVYCRTTQVTATATVWRDGLRVLPDSEAQVLWRYTDKFFGGLGLAAVTKRTVGLAGGAAIYIGAGLDPEALVPLAGEALKAKAIAHAGLGPSDQVGMHLRTDANGQSWRIAINHGDDAAETNWGALEPYGIIIQPVSKAGLSGPGR